MVHGKFGLQTPLDILLRAIDTKASSELSDVLANADIFRWSEDAEGNSYLSPRHPLEARLIAQSKLGGPRSEVAFARQLLLEVQDSGLPGDPEVNFAVGLVQSMGPNAPDHSYFCPYFQELSECLTKLERREVSQTSG